MIISMPHHAILHYLCIYALYVMHVSILELNITINQTVFRHENTACVRAYGTNTNILVYWPFINNNKIEI